MTERRTHLEEQAVALLRQGVYDEADDLIERSGLDWAEMYIRAGKFPEIKGEPHGH